MCDNSGRRQWFTSHRINKKRQKKEIQKMQQQKNIYKITTVVFLSLTPGSIVI